MRRRQYKLHGGEKDQVGIYGVSLKNSGSSDLSIDAGFINEHQRTHLHLGILIYCTDDALFEESLKAGCDVNVRDHNQYSALHYAAEKGLVTCVDKLIRRGAHLDSFTQHDMTPLMLASRHGHPAVVKSLVKAGAGINLTNQHGQLALHFCCANGHQECVELLLTHKSKVNYPDNDENTPLILACKSSKARIVQALIDKGVRVDKADSMGRSPLHLAVLAGNSDIVQILLKQDVDIDATDKQYRTPFGCATFTNKPEILQMLIDAGCERSTIDGLNGTAMALAALKGYASCVRILLDAGEDPDEFGFFGMSALIAAVYESRSDITEMLLRGGANPSVVSRMGFTPMISCICHVRPQNAAARHQQAAMLLQYGADVNYRMHSAMVFTDVTNGKTCPITLAITSGYVSLVKMFLIAGSDTKCSEIGTVIQRNNTAAMFDIDAILEPIKQYRRNPVPLSNLCRLTIRKHLGFSCVDKIKCLGIAPGLKDYLNFKELFLIEPEYASTQSMVSDFMARFLNVKACSLDTLRGSLLYDNIKDPVLQSQAPGPCDCDVCQRLRARAC